MALSSSEVALTTAIDRESFGGRRAERLCPLALHMGACHSWGNKYSIDLLIFLSLGLGI